MLHSTGPRPVHQEHPAHPSHETPPTPPPTSAAQGPQRSLALHPRPSSQTLRPHEVEDNSLAHPSSPHRHQVEDSPHSSLQVQKPFQGVEVGQCRPRCISQVFSVHHPCQWGMVQRCRWRGSRQSCRCVIFGAENQLQQAPCTVCNPFCRVDAEPSHDSSNPPSSSFEDVEQEVDLVDPSRPSTRPSEPRSSLETKQPIPSRPQWFHAG